MTKQKKSLVTDQSQMSLFDLLKHDRELREETAPGRLNIAARLMAAVKLAIKDAPKSRETLADELTELMGYEITVHMINSWVADSHPHRIPAEVIPALCVATGSNEPLRIQAEAAGLFTLDGPDALRSEMQKDIEMKRRIERNIRQKEALLKALECPR